MSPYTQPDALAYDLIMIMLCLVVSAAIIWSNRRRRRSLM
jgi:hypothetical protein